MSSRDFCDTRCERFYTEMLNKENYLRMKWFLKNQQRLADHLEKMKPEEEIEILAPKYEMTKKQATKLIRLKSQPHWRPPNSDGSIDISIMKPVHPEIRSILYEKNVPSFITADNYILKRVKEPPENRHYYPDCTNWIYGWHLGDYLPIPRSKVGMKSVMLTEYYHPTLSSLQPNPPWYRTCYKEGLTICNEN